MKEFYKLARIDWFSYRAILLEKPTKAIIRCRTDAHLWWSNCNELWSDLISPSIRIARRLALSIYFPKSDNIAISSSQPRNDFCCCIKLHNVIKRCVQWFQFIVAFRTPCLLLLNSTRWHFFLGYITWKPPQIEIVYERSRFTILPFRRIILSRSKMTSQGRASPLDCQSVMGYI